MWPVLDAMPQDIDRAALADLALQAGQELASGGAICVQVECLGGSGLSSIRKARS